MKIIWAKRMSLKKNANKRKQIAKTIREMNAVKRRKFKAEKWKRKIMCARKMSS